MMDSGERFNRLMVKYIAALKVLETQIEIINDDFKYIKKYNPIEHIKSRIKSADSIEAKLLKENKEFTVENVEEYINDIVGIRIICAFKKDIYELIELIRRSDIIKVIKEKDYIENPKKSGYRSYHIIVEVPVELINEKTYVRAEIQIRTLAMDLWASLDHKLSYKEDDCPDHVLKKLYEVSNQMNKIDDEMNELITEKQQLDSE